MVQCKCVYIYIYVYIYMNIYIYVYIYIWTQIARQIDRQIGRQDWIGLDQIRQIGLDQIDRIRLDRIGLDQIRIDRQIDRQIEDTYINEQNKHIDNMCKTPECESHKVLN